jgi:hypothetical protein
MQALFFSSGVVASGARDCGGWTLTVMLYSTSGNTGANFPVRRV